MAPSISENSIFSITEIASTSFEVSFTNSTSQPANFSPPRNDSLDFYVHLDVKCSSGDDQNLALYFSTPKLSGRKLLVQWRVSLVDVSSESKHSKVCILKHSPDRSYFTCDFLKRQVISRDASLLRDGNLLVHVEVRTAKLREGK